MTISSGFFDSVESDRLYSAAQMNGIFTGLITDGILENYDDAFDPSTNTTMFITIGGGRAWFNETWTHNDGDVDLEIAVSEPVLDRIDTIVLEINTSISVRANSLKVIEGIPASTPVAPDLISTDEINQYPLVDVYIAAAVTGLYPTDITKRIGTIDTPYTTQPWIQQATNAIKGIVELATLFEVNVGTDNERAVTPSVLAASDRNVKLDGIEAGADVTDWTNVRDAGAVMDSEVDADIKTLALPADTTISTFIKTFLATTGAGGARGVIEALGSLIGDTTPQLGGNLDINSQFIKLTKSPGNLTGNGIMITGTVDVNAYGFAAVLHMAADGHWETSDADLVTKSPGIGMAMNSGTGADKGILLQGIVRKDAWNWTLGGGEAGLIYLGTALGQMTQTQPTGSGDQIQVLGYALASNVMYFNPSLVLVERA